MYDAWTRRGGFYTAGAGHKDGVLDKASKQRLTCFEAENLHVIRYIVVGPTDRMVHLLLIFCMLLPLSANWMDPAIL